MAVSDAPFMYSAVKDDDRFPATTFDPKAVTRASYERKKPKPKKNGPLVSVNRHPDAHGLPALNSNFRMMGRKTKAAIKGFRVVQLILRVLELIAAAGNLVLFILIKGALGPTAWILRITLGVAVVHCTYGIIHLFKPAGSRTPGSSTAYHAFAGLSDFCVIPLYAYGVYQTHQQGELWQTIIGDETMLDYFVPAIYYSLIAAGGLHLISLAISAWLAVMFRKITQLPPDMNPLESHLTARAHKRNKSSLATVSTAYTDSTETRMSTPADRRSVPFSHTRQNSEITLTNNSSSHRDSRLDLPSRQYQIQPANRASLPPPPPPHSSSPKTSRPTSLYSLPLQAQVSSGTVSSFRVAGSTTQQPSPKAEVQPRSAKFTEAWYTSPSLVARTRAKSYNTLHHNPDDDNSDDSDDENDDQFDGDNNYRTSLGQSAHSNPLGSNPASKKGGFSRLRDSVVHKRMSALNGERDIGEAGRMRDSSIQLDEGFVVTKRYGELKPGTPPIPYGEEQRGNNRVVSSTGHDLGDMGFEGGGRMRHVSGRQAEEGIAGGWR
ncbi:hypothetical protein QBC38DRAFT_534639 [Podospora fimiseda]|uniref:Uncharacterized protein n=1 Tax=Podospora fimiseda TaxID=252190 RepID=A0AAN7BV30_9PEZI|nr:hypothetical protein QBC38DRAFT_534639 [Podospora fimiseda]